MKSELASSHESKASEFVIKKTESTKAGEWVEMAFSSSALVFIASKLNFELKLTFSHNQVKITSSIFLFQIHCKKKANYFLSFSDRLAR